MKDIEKQVVEKLKTGDLAKDDNTLSLAAEMAHEICFYDRQVEGLEEALLAALARYQEQKEPRVISGLIFALYKLRNGKHKAVLQEHLRSAFASWLAYNQIVYQTLLTLSDCEDKIAVLDWEKDDDGTSHTSLGHDDYDKIATLARQYIEAIDRLDPTTAT